MNDKKLFRTVRRPHSDVTIIFVANCEAMRANSCTTSAHRASSYLTATAAVLFPLFILSEISIVVIAKQCWPPGREKNLESGDSLTIGCSEDKEVHECRLNFNRQSCSIYKGDGA